MRCLFFFFLLASRLTQFSYGFYGFYGFIEGGSKFFTLHSSLFTRPSGRKPPCNWLCPVQSVLP